MLTGILLVRIVSINAKQAVKEPPGLFMMIVKLSNLGSELSNESSMSVVNIECPQPSKLGKNGIMVFCLVRTL